MNKWKVIAIVSIIINILFLWLMISTVSSALEIIINEDECVNICSEYEEYFYDQTDESCYCFEDDEPVLVRSLK